MIQPKGVANKTKLLVVFLFILSSVHAQRGDTLSSATSNTAKKNVVKVKNTPKPIVIPTPEFINQPYYYDEPDNKLTKLENVNAKVITKKKTLGIGGAKQYYSMEGASSKILFTASRNISFIVRTNGDMMDLTSFIKLYRFTTADDKRETVISERDGIIKNKEESKNTTVMINVKKLSKESYLISPAQPLEAGEYGFVLNGANPGQELTIFAFGIDWKKSD
jgi:hypothetical protein